MHKTIGHKHTIKRIIVEVYFCSPFYGNYSTYPTTYSQEYSYSQVIVTYFIPRIITPIGC